MKKAMLVILLLLGCGTLFAETHFSLGIGIGGYGPVYEQLPPPPPAYEIPPCPGEGYAWVDGYWYPQGPRFYWRSGYWRAPAYFGYRGGRGYGHGYGRSEGHWGEGRWSEGRGYDRGRHEDRGRYNRNEFRHEDRRERHEADRYRR